MSLSSLVSQESRVLVIYTGGTIGMLVGQHGYVPEPYFLTETLRSQTRFHDPLQDSLFSNSSSVQGFRDWSANSSGRSSPQPISTTIPAAGTTIPTLRVRSSRPIGHPPSSLSSDLRSVRTQPKCVQVADSIYEAQLPTLVTPRSAVPGETTSKSIRYAILEWDPLLDSSNIEIQDWIRIATEIELNYHFDAFVVLHGTDTMSYTSSALSFLLEDLGKTVIITGAQIPLSQLRNDAVDNLIGALTIAGQYIIPECCLYFNHTLYRGNRVSKMSSYDLNAFDSPNFRPLVNVGIDILVNWSDVIRQTSLRRFRAHKEMSPHVATLRLFPGISATTIKAFLMPPIRGVVLETFGAGNAPQRPEVIQYIKEACERGVVIVAISQCVKGSVSDAYETGRTLVQSGVVPGCDMTPECALTKLSYLLSKPELSVEQVRDMMAIPLRGELTRPAGSVPPSQLNIEQNLENIQGVLSQFMRLSQPRSAVPKISLTSNAVQSKSADATAPWSWTAAEAVNTEAVLLPFLVHLAAARDDIETLSFCLASFIPEESIPTSPSSEMSSHGHIAGGIVNCIDPGSGRSPLHVAALNGNSRSVNYLLRSGALVHLRDHLNHTALYYAARQGYEAIVDILNQAGAKLGGSDEGFAKYAINDAIRIGNEAALKIWVKTGTDIAETSIYRGCE